MTLRPAALAALALALLAAPTAACPFLRGAGGARALAAFPADPAPARPARALQQASMAPLTAALAAEIAANLDRLMDADPTLMPTFMRLIFHDASGPGGVDGCVNMRVPFGINLGLQHPMDALERFYNGATMRLSPTADISRADLWALAGLAAARRGAGAAAPAALRVDAFRWGRVSCAGSPDAGAAETPADFASPNPDLATTLAFFADRFQFSPAEVVTIMGAHNLGSAKANQSGFDGAWTRRGDRLGTEFYEELAGRGWAQASRVVGPADAPAAEGERFFWVKGGGGAGRQAAPQGGPGRGDGGGFMLNSDMALLRALAPDPITGRDAACPRRSDDCAESATAAAVRRYAAPGGDALFLPEFAAVYTRMLARGAGPLQALVGAAQFPAPDAGRGGRDGGRGDGGGDGGRDGPRG